MTTTRTSKAQRRTDAAVLFDTESRRWKRLLFETEEEALFAVDAATAADIPATIQYRRPGGAWVCIPQD